MAKQEAKLEEKTASDCLDGAVTEIRFLRDEIIEWKDNIEEYFSGTEKYNALEEAAEGLESGHEAMEGWETHADELDKFNTDLMETKLQVYQFKFTRRGLARWRRLSNSLNCLEAASEFFERLKEQASNADELVPSGVGEALGELVEMINTCADHIDSVAFPTMFG